MIDGYDPSAVLRANGLSARAAPDYDYNSFAGGVIFGGIDISYTDFQTGLRTNFNEQLSEVGQYDLIFLNFDNDTDFIQRNALLVERLIQWVNDNKQPLNGSRQQNIVLGMSMGGLVARYALHDMEQRQASGAASFSHDTKLYISHEAPHQGANVPLGVQHAVSSLVNTNLGPGFTAASFSPQLKAFAKLLEEPATQQLLIYQTTSLGTGLHNTWLNEYNSMGYPTQCRNVATSDGSECGRPQDFAPYAELLNIQGSGLLDDPYNSYANLALFGGSIAIGGLLAIGVGPLGLFAGYAAGFIMALGNFEGHADFIVNALPSQRRERIYHGKFTICKDILFGLFSTCLVDYSDNRYSDASMLAYDSAPGGVYDLNQVSAGAISQIGSALPIAQVRVYVQPRFCFIPTTSALDIGGGSVALAPQNLLNAYSGASRPAPPFSTPFANFVTASRENLTHILWNGLNSKWVFQEMQGVPQVFDCQAFCQALPTISGPAVACANGTTYTVTGLPPGTTVTWNLSTTAPVATSQNGNSFTVYFTGTGYLAGAKGTLGAFISSECGQLSISLPIDVGNKLRISSVPTNACGLRAHADMVGYQNLEWLVNGDPSTTAYTGPDEYFEYVGNSVSVALRGTDACTGAVYTSNTVTARRPIKGSPCMNRSSASAQPTIFLYPNPARESVDVHVENVDAVQYITVRLFDSLGRLRVERMSAGQGTIQLLTAQLPAGLYFVHILHGQEVLGRQQLRLEK